jgi:phage regulator Rha-like protein
LNNLVSLKGNDVFTDSWIISEMTGNSHQAVAKLLNKYTAYFESFGELSDYLKSTNEAGTRHAKCYYLNEPQATLLMTFLGNSPRVIEFKKELVRQFYEMRRFILERQSNEWIATRYQGKLTRKAETDTIQKLVDYAQGQGSTHADKLYMTYSKLANKVAGITDRDAATIAQLNNLSLIENIILHVVDAGIITDKHYKDIYQDCKKRLDMFKDLAYLEAS